MCEKGCLVDSVLCWLKCLGHRVTVASGLLSGRSLKMSEGLCTSMLMTPGRPASFPPSNSTFLSSLCGLGDTR